MNKKSQGLSINLIIIVSIALVVLVVVIAIFTGKMGDWVGQTKEAKTCISTCSGIGMGFGQAADIESCVGRYLPGTYGDLTADNVCCCV